MIVVIAFLRSLLSVLVLFPVWTIGLSLVAITYTSVGNNPKFAKSLMSVWARGVCWMFGVEVRTYGREHLPPGTFVLLFNHKSFFDIFAIGSALPDIRFGAKIELFRIPIFGRAMRKMGVLPIARGNVENVVRVYKAAEAETRKGARYALAPEGTRNTGPETLLPFKSGPFLFALSAKSPIVPLIVRGAARVWPTGYLVPQPLRLGSVIELHFLETVPVENLGFEKTAQAKNFLQEKVFRAMNDKVLELRRQEATSPGPATRSPDQNGWTPGDGLL